MAMLLQKGAERVHGERGRGENLEKSGEKANYIFEISYNSQLGELY